MTESKNRDFTDPPQEEKEGSGKKTVKPPPKQKSKRELQLESQVKELTGKVEILTSQSVVLPEAFMNFDVFCLSMGVTKLEYTLLLKSLRTDPEFYEVSEQTRRLFGRTGIKHLFKIRDAVTQKIKAASKQRKKAKK